MTADRRRVLLFATVLTTVVGLSAASDVLAHCDTLDGPLVAESKAALDKQDVTPVLKWVKAADEPAIRAAFARAVAVRGKGPEARELADLYFLETVVRIHRAGEGAPYTGLKNEPPTPIIAAADKALAEGSVEALTQKVAGHVVHGIRARFEAAAEKKKRANDSVGAGREYVAAYVEYTHYLEGIHRAAMGAAGHHEEAGASEATHAH